ncbi:transglycosylase SLT domain-containing protein [Streptomyces scabiei]|uniref:transglycosylase SLT domain-containing protein n=1 Tax=Streptomyces scabiei TaxID=1930 RepID=UPI00378DC131
MDQAELSRELEKFEAAVKTEYKRASDVTQAYARLRVELEKWVTAKFGDQAKGRLALAEQTLKAQTALQKTESAQILKALDGVEKAELASERRKTAAKQAATRRKERIALNARDLEIKYGQQVADDYLAQIKVMQKGKQKLTLTQINETKRWAELEQAEIRRTSALQREADQQAIRGAQITATKRAEAAKKAQAVYTQTFEAVKSQTLQAMQLDQMRTRARLEGELAVREASVSTAAAQLAGAKASLAQVATATSRQTLGMIGGWKKVSGSIERVGTTATELGRTLMHSVVTPMAAAGAALTAWGLKAADNFQNTQTSLKNMGMALKDANDLMNNLTTYGLKTPYAVGDMLTYGTRFSRAIGAHNDNFTSSDPKKHAKGSREVSTEAQNIVQMIGDLAARGGITDSSMVQRGYYAMEKLMDADRVSLRDTKQLEYAVNMPVQELAQLLGFTDKKYTAKQVKDFKKVNPGFHAKAGDKYAASAQMMEVMANAKTTGGVRGQDMVEGLLNYWMGKTNVPGAKPDKNIRGSAERLGTATFGSRLSNMKETAQQNLRGMVQRFNPKTGELEYTGLGAAIMGKKVTDNQKYIQVGVGAHGQEIYKKNPNYGKSHWEGGLLNQFAGIGSDLMGKKGKGAVPQLMKGFVEGLTDFVKKIKWIADELGKHPEIVKWIKEFGKLVAKVAPALILIGTVGKIFGKLGKLLTPVLTGVKGVSKAVGGTWKIGNQIARGVQSKMTGGSYRAGYRAQRGLYNGGDSRSRSQQRLDRRTGTDSRTEALRLDISKYQEEMDKAKAEADSFRKKIRDLNKQNLNKLAHEAAGNDSSVEGALKKATKASDKAKAAVEELNKRKLKALKNQYSNITSAAGNAGSGTGKLQKKITQLGNQSLKDLRDWFKKVTKAAGDTHTKVSKLSTAVHDLNGKKTDQVTGEIKSLKSALSDAKDEAGLLILALDDINKKGGNGKGGKGKAPRGPRGPKRRHAAGGVLPGYTPGRDVHRFVSPTAGELHLSGGEAIMRPEFTEAVGHSFIHKLNHVARTKGVGGVRHAMKFAKGGIMGKLGLDRLVEAAKQFNIGPDALSAFATMAMDSSSRRLAAPTASGVTGTGTNASHFVGSDLSTKFRGMYDFMTKDSWKILKKLPIPDGWSQVVGILGGALSPITGQYFWDDVWKGHGNILQRGSAYMSDLFSPKTLIGVIENLFGGLWDSVKSLWSGGKALLTDPVGTVEDSISGLWDLGKSEYDGVIDMVKSLRSFATSPLDYAGQVVSDIYDTAKDSLPNTEGLFDFSGNHLTAKKPNVSKLVDGQLSTPGKGSGATKWTPQVKMALAQLGLPASALDLVLHRIQVESGGNPKAINNWDSNAKAGQNSRGLMQTIPSTFAAYAGPYVKRGIYDPLASIYAGLNYAVHRYGKGWQKALSGTKGYASGTSGAANGWAWVGEEGPELVKFRGGETVLNHRDSMLATVKVLKGYASGTGSKRTTGVAADAEKGVSSLNAAVKKLYEIITKAFTSGRIGSGTANSLNKWLDKENKKLQKLVKDRADLAPKLKDANKKLADIKKQESDMASSISDNAKGLRSLTDVFNEGGVSASAGLSSLHQRLAAIKSFQSDLTALTKKGFSKDIIAEIAQAGPEQGDAMAKELLKSTASQVSDYNKVYKAIGTASDSLGKSVAGSYYKAGKQAAQSLVDGLTDKDNKLKKAIEGIANTITKTLKSKLHFNSKTPVDSGLAALLTWLTGESQAVKGKKKATPKKTTRVTTSYSTDSKGRKVVTVTTTVSDPAKGTTTTTTERTVNGKTTKSTKVSHTKGYWTGTRSASPGIALVGERGPELVNFSGGERVYNAKDTAHMGGPKYEIHIHEAKAENTTQSVLRAMKYAETMAAL